MKYTTKRNQTIVDLSVQLYGSPEFLFNILADSGLDINAEVSALVSFIANNGNAGVIDVKEFFRNRVAANSNFSKTLGFGPDFGDGFGSPQYFIDDDVAEFVSLKLFQGYDVDTDSVLCLNSFVKKIKLL